MGERRKMLSDDLLRRLVDRPEIHAGSRTLSAVLAFIAGYGFALADANLDSTAFQSDNRILDAVRLRLSMENGLDPGNALSILQLVRRKVGDDELLGFEEFRALVTAVMGMY
jgi:hypothetical protein